MQQPTAPLQPQDVQQQPVMMDGIGYIHQEVATMRQEFNEVKEMINRCERKHTISEENELLRQENIDLQNECEKLRKANQKLQHQMGEYVDILTNSPNDQVMDQDVICKFKELRSLVYGAVTEVWTPKFKEVVLPDKDEQMNVLKDKLACKGSLNVLRLQHHFCRVIFQALLKNIFGRPLFGHYNPESDAADALSDVEKHFTKIVPKGHSKAVTQWRLATVKAEFMAKERILQICNDAVELKLLMRKAEDHLSVRDIHGQQMTGMSDFAVNFGSEPCDTSDLSQTIAFTRFGTLLKFPIGEQQEPIVLEKAHAVVYDKSPK
ncbi:hypothetical protein PG993_012305 [Apiospora rasikravindrae]|uniref:Uncharacterized protein n=1 Tax=Apiospora rasikravindrae TaxID=990691 RepID=A0ABR1S232_9PEZI